MPYITLYSHYIAPIFLGSSHISLHKLQGSLFGVPPKVLRLYPTMQTHIVTELAMDSEKSYLLEQLAAVSATPNSPRFAEFKELALLKGSGFRVQGSGRTCADNSFGLFGVVAGFTMLLFWNSKTNTIMRKPYCLLYTHVLIT